MLPYRYMISPHHKGALCGFIVVLASGWSENLMKAVLKYGQCGSLYVPNVIDSMATDLN
jgi:hypothetical protein